MDCCNGSFGATLNQIFPFLRFCNRRDFNLEFENLLGYKLDRSLLFYEERKSKLLVPSKTNKKVPFLITNDALANGCRINTPRLSAQMFTGVLLVEKYGQSFTGELVLCTEGSMIIGGEL